MLIEVFGTRRPQRTVCGEELIRVYDPNAAARKSFSAASNDLIDSLIGAELQRILLARLAVKFFSVADLAQLAAAFRPAEIQIREFIVDAGGTIICQFGFGEVSVRL